MVKPLSEEQKKARTINKKIKAVQALRDKQERGEKLEPEQVTKLDTLDALRRQLEDLAVKDTPGVGESESG